MTISSIKRAIINKQNNTEDYSQNMKNLQDAYRNRQPQWSRWYIDYITAFDESAIYVFYVLMKWSFY